MYSVYFNRCNTDISVLTGRVSPSLQLNVFMENPRVGSQATGNAQGMTAVTTFLLPNSKAHGLSTPELRPVSQWSDFDRIRRGLGNVEHGDEWGDFTALGSCAITCNISNTGWRLT